MTLRLKNRLIDIGMAIVAVLAGAVVIYIGDMLLGVKLEYFFGVATFSPLWVLDLFFVPFVAGVLVSYIYGLGGKILAHLPPLLVRIPSYYMLSNGASVPPGVEVLPMGYWILVVIIAAEFAAFGGVVGEIIVKRTYGRSPKELLHKKYQQKDVLPEAPHAMSHKPGTIEK